MAFLKQKIIVSNMWSSFCERGGQTRTREGNQLCLSPHAHSERDLSWVEDEGIGVPFVLIKSLSFSFSLLLFFLLPFFLSLPFFYCPRLYMCGVIVFYCWVTNLHTLDDLQQLPSTLFRAVQIGSWAIPLLNSLLGVSKVQNQSVIPATFCFGTWGPPPRSSSTCVFWKNSTCFIFLNIILSSYSKMICK